jgi:TPR repeat protein
MGVPQDFNQAVAFYTQASEQGNPEAYLNLGLMYQVHGLNDVFIIEFVNCSFFCNSDFCLL